VATLLDIVTKVIFLPWSSHVQIFYPLVLNHFHHVTTTSELFSLPLTIIFTTNSYRILATNDQWTRSEYGTRVVPGWCVKDQFCVVLPG
jgi:hypothetical protein